MNNRIEEILTDTKTIDDIDKEIKQISEGHYNEQSKVKNLKAFE
jgi:hypothetical protein